MAVMSKRKPKKEMRMNSHNPVPLKKPKLKKKKSTLHRK